MSASARRPITLFDLMVVVAATAIGLSLVQFGWTRKVAGGWVSTWPVTSSYSDGYPSTRWFLPIAGRAAVPALLCGLERGVPCDTARRASSSQEAAAQATRFGRGSRGAFDPGDRVDPADRLRHSRRPIQMGECGIDQCLLRERPDPSRPPRRMGRHGLVAHARPHRPMASRAELGQSLGACPRLHVDHRRAGGEHLDRP